MIIPSVNDIIFKFLMEENPQMPLFINRVNNLLSSVIHPFTFFPFFILLIYFFGQAPLGNVTAWSFPP